MNKSSRKQTNKHYMTKGMVSAQFAAVKYSDSAKPVTQQWVSRAEINKFKGMADDLEEVQPEIIPGYKIRG